MKFKFYPKHYGDEFTVFLQLESISEEECDYEIEDIIDSLGKTVNITFFHEEDIRKLNELAEALAYECAREIFREARYSLVEDWEG